MDRTEHMDDSMEKVVLYRIKGTDICCSVDDEGIEGSYYYLIDIDRDPDLEKIVRLFRDETRIACVDRKVAASYGRKVCEDYCNALRLHDRAVIAKETGFMGSGSLVRVSGGASCSDGSSLLRKILSVDSNDRAISEFMKLLDMVERYGGKTGPVLKEYLVLRYVRYYSFNRVVDLWKDRYSRSRVGEISRTAHLMVAYLTSSVPVRLKEKRILP